MNFKQLLTDCLVALGDADAETWSRLDVIWPWCIEAIQSFPILRPMLQDYTSITSSWTIALPADFREMISVEYPISQQPPAYMVRKNRLDPEFFSSITYFDVDHDYSAGVGWTLYLSTQYRAATHLKIQYLANHDTDMDDEDTSIVTIPDEYETILITQVMCRAYRERLSVVLQDPTAHTTIVDQLTKTVEQLEATYASMVAAARSQLAQSVITPHRQVDKFDRVY